jgi:ribosomal subunit interface protein
METGSMERVHSGATTMQLPIEIAFQNMDPSPAVEARVREKAAVLERFSDRIVHCRVVIEAPHRHSRKGNRYAVRITVAVPGREIAVSRSGPRDQAHQDVYVAVRDAFNAMRRRLEDHARTRRGDVKTHEPPPHGRVERLFAAEGYGFIVAADGREIYFHRNSVLNDGFDALAVGDEVRFAEEDGEKGSQASTVVPVGKHHIV